MNGLRFFKVRLIAAAFAAVMLSSCTTTTPTLTQDTDETVFVIVRHAEKGVDDPKNPSLSNVGYARAQRLAERLSARHVSAVYATGYLRTQQTAEPTAAGHGLAVSNYDAAQPAAEFATQLRYNHHDAKVVLVVGHSNTVAAIAGALCTCIVAPLREDEYDRWITIRMSHSSRHAILEETRY